MELFEYIWENGLISFDTSSLGRMYEWESLYAVNIKDAISYLYSKGKIWETDVSITEFTKQRIEIKNSIYEQKFVKGIFQNLQKRPIPWEKINKKMNRWESRGFSNSFKKILLDLQGRKKITDEEYNSVVEASYSTSVAFDIEELFDKLMNRDGFVLSELEKSDLQKRYDTGEICPGSEDKTKNNENKYNDLYIWELLKKKAKAEDIDIIFVTVDQKEDWFQKDSGEPRTEYIQEFRDETGHDILILTLTDFWEKCKPFLEVSVERFIEISTIKEQLKEKYDDCYQEDICDKINEMIFETDDIKNELEDIVDCCVDMPVLEELVETCIEGIKIEDYDRDYVEASVMLRTEAVFNAQNHTCCEDWSAGEGSVLLNLVASAQIPVIWSSEDTERMVLDDKIEIDEIADIEVIDREY